MLLCTGFKYTDITGRLNVKLVFNTLVKHYHMQIYDFSKSARGIFQSVALNKYMTLLPFTYIQPACI